MATVDYYLNPVDVKDSHVLTRIVDPSQGDGGLGKPPLARESLGEVARSQIGVALHRRRDGPPKGSRRNTLRSGVIGDDPRIEPLIA